MAKLIRAIKGDVNYIKSHTLQPQWFKVLKVFILVGVLISYYLLFGFIITVIFFAVFFFLMLSVHFVYRFKTNKFQRSWLDFVVEESEGEIKGKSIGIFYYSAIVINAIIAFIASQLLAGG